MFSHNEGCQPIAALPSKTSMRFMPKYTPPKRYGKAMGEIFGILSQRLLCQKGLDSFHCKGGIVTCSGASWRQTGAQQLSNSTCTSSTASWLPFMIRCHSHTTTHPLQPFGCTSVSFAGLSLSLVFGNTPFKPRVSFTQSRVSPGVSTRVSRLASCRTQVGDTHPCVSLHWHFISPMLVQCRCIDCNPWMPLHRLPLSAFNLRDHDVSLAEVAC